MVTYNHSTWVSSNQNGHCKLSNCCTVTMSAGWKSSTVQSYRHTRRSHSVIAWNQKLRSKIWLWCRKSWSNKWKQPSVDHQPQHKRLSLCWGPSCRTGRQRNSCCYKPSMICRSAFPQILHLCFSAVVQMASTCYSKINCFLERDATVGKHSIQGHYQPVTEWDQ